MVFVRSLMVILLITVVTVLGCNRSPSERNPSELSSSGNVGRGPQEPSLISPTQLDTFATEPSSPPSSPADEDPSSKEPEVASAAVAENGPSTLVLRDEEPLLLLDDEEPGNHKTELMADNSRCLVCHLNYEMEDIARVHAREGYGCAYCHGQSDAHIADESWASGGNGTAPDIMYRPTEVIPSCLKCHELSKSDPECRCEFPRLEEKKLCTDCHGSHRLKSRKCNWK